MSEAVVRGVIYIAIILLTCLAKKRDRFVKEQSFFLGVLIVTFTLPATLVANHLLFVFDFTNFFLFLLGILCNGIMLYVGYKLHPKRTPHTAAIMLSLASYNVGGFLMPFVQFFYPGKGLIYICSFDAGNAFMGLGMNYVLARAVSDPKQKLTGRFIYKSLTSSMPLMTYVTLFTLSLLHIEIPDLVQSGAEMIASANPFLSMVMIGLMIDFSSGEKSLMEIGHYFLIRMEMNILFALLVFFFAPIPFLARVMAVICLFSPVATVTLVFGQRCNYEGDLIGMVSVFSLLFSLAIVLLSLSSLFA